MQEAMKRLEDFLIKDREGANRVEMGAMIGTGVKEIVIFLRVLRALGFEIPKRPRGFCSPELKAANSKRMKRIWAASREMEARRDLDKAA